MSRIPKKVASWIYTVLQPQYTNAEIAYRDIYRFLAVYMAQGFKIRTAVYTSPLGSSQLLIELHGTVQIGQDAVPLKLWVPHNYPFADERVMHQAPNGVPVVLVAPAEGYAIRSSNNVDLQGRFYHPFVTLWHTDMRSELQLAQYNLVSLMDCVLSTFSRWPPVARVPLVTGPALPPKPQLYAQATGGEGSSENMGNVPLKYRSPPPLPTQVPGPSQMSPAPLTTQPTRFSPVQSPHTTGGSFRPVQIPHGPPTRNPVGIPPYPAQNPKSSSLLLSVSPKKTLSQTQRPNAELGNLMDQVTLSSEEKHPSDFLEKIAQAANKILSPQNPDSINLAILQINEIHKRSTALSNQLEHHNKQAVANAENLQSHIDYLEVQLEAIQNLNNSLFAIDQKSETTENIVDLCCDQKMPIEDVVVADLRLVDQLYDTVAEIKGCKDAIGLVNGHFGSELEIINDQNLDSCIKSVRGLSRELFWLELTKHAIGEKMGLQ